MSDDTLGSSRDRLALVALLKIFFVVVLSNVALYLLIVYFAIINFHRGVPSFLAFIQFLTFILPIALILRLGLRETPAVAPIENPFLKKIGATPTLVVISSFAAFFATFTPLGAQMFPAPEPFATSMFAKVGVACRIDKDQSASKGAYFLTLIWSDDTEYIATVRQNLRSLQISSKDDAKERNDVAKPAVYSLAESMLANALISIGLFQPTPPPSEDELYSKITFVERSDQFYKLLKQSTLGSNESYDLRSYLTEDSRWIAFITPVGEPQAYTRVPILTRFGTRNHTRVYLVTFPDDNGPKNLSTNPLDAAIAVPIHESHDPKFEIRKISEVEILPRPPDSVTQKADFNVVVFPTQSCWITSPNDAL